MAFSHKTEVILNRLCDGYSIAEIMRELEINRHEFDTRVRRIRSCFYVPYTKDFAKNRDKIKDNYEKWKKYDAEIEIAKQKFLQSISTDYIESE